MLFCCFGGLQSVVIPRHLCGPVIIWLLVLGKTDFGAIDPFGGNAKRCRSVVIPENRMQPGLSELFLGFAQDWVGAGVGQV